MQKELYEIETSWGGHWVTEGFGKYTGKFVAQSRGAGGAEGYFKVFDTLDEAKNYVDQQTKPLPEADRPAIMQHAGRST